MNLRRLAVDAGIVAVLAVATAVVGAQVLRIDQVAALKLGTERTQQFHAEVTWWWIATGVGASAMLVRSELPLVALAGAGVMSLVHASVRESLSNVTTVS